jgi:hypothetical protein
MSSIMLMHEAVLAIIIIKCPLALPLIDKITVNSSDDPIPS